VLLLTAIHRTPVSCSSCVRSPPLPLVPREHAMPSTLPMVVALPIAATTMMVRVFTLLSLNQPFVAAMHSTRYRSSTTLEARRKYE